MQTIVSWLTVICDVSLQGTRGTAGATSDAKGEHLPLVHVRGSLNHQVSPQKMKQRHVTGEQPHLMKHTTDIAAYGGWVLSEEKQ